MVTINTDYATNLPWIGWKNGHNEWVINLLEDGSPKDITAYTFRLDIYKNDNTRGTPLLSLTQGQGLTNGTTAGTIRNVLTQTQAGTTLKGKDFYYVLSYTFDSKSFGLYKGKLTLNTGNNPGSTTTTTSATVVMAGADGSYTSVIANVTLAGGGGEVTSETITEALGDQSPATVYAGPANGANGTPTFRALTQSDLPETPVDTFATELKFDYDKHLATSTGGAHAFTLAASGNKNGVGVVLRLNKPESVEFPTNFEAANGSDSISSTDMNIVTMVYFEDYDGFGSNKVIYVVKNQAAASRFSDVYQAILDKGTALGYTLPSDALQTIQDDALQLILDEAGLWDKVKLFCVYKTDGDSNFATLNWKDPDNFQATKVNAPTFTSLEGYRSNGTTSYLNNIITLAAVNQQSVCFFAKGLDNSAQGNSSLFGVGAISASSVFLNPRNASNSMTYKVSGSSNATLTGVTDARNRICIGRDGANIFHSINGAAKVSSANTFSSVDTSRAMFSVASSGGSAEGFNTRGIAYLVITDLLSDAEIAIIDSALAALTA